MRGRETLVEHLDRVAAIIVDNASEIGRSADEAAVAAYLLYLIVDGNAGIILNFINGGTAGGMALMLRRQQAESNEQYFERLATAGRVVIALKLAKRIAELESPVDVELYDEDWSCISAMRRPGELTTMWSRFNRLQSH